MKKLIAFTLLSIAILKSAHAFQVKAKCEVYRTQAYCFVYNEFPRPLICSGKMNAQLRSGHFMYEYMNNAIIYPGQNMYMNAWTNNYNPFTWADANIDCRWAY